MLLVGSCGSCVCAGADIGLGTGDAVAGEAAQSDVLRNLRQILDDSEALRVCCLFVCCCSGWMCIADRRVSGRRCGGNWTTTATGLSALPRLTALLCSDSGALPSRP